MKKLWVSFGALALLVGLVAAVAPAGAQQAQGEDVPWPTLRVSKTYPEGRKAPAGTVFTIHVECDYPEKAEVDGQSIDPVDLLFTADGSANPAAPTEPGPDGWVTDGQYWTFTSKWLKNKDCTAEETDASAPGGPLASLTVLNKCDFTSEFVAQPTEDQADAAGNSGSPGCLNPNVNGGTVAGPTPPGAVRFTSPWDIDWKADPKVCDQGPPDLVQESSNVDSAGSYQKCQQIGTLTVINDKPGDPEWSVAGIAVDFNPNFTG